MKQERLQRSLEWITRGIMYAEQMAKKTKPMYSIQGKTLLILYRPIRHALNKAIEQPVRAENGRTFCRSCGAAVKRGKNNYCQTCGQRLAWEREPENYYGRFIKANNKKERLEHGKQCK